MTLTIASALLWANEQLTAHGVSDDGFSQSAKIDSRVLLAACLEREPVYLHTWPEKTLTEQQEQRFRDFVLQRIEGHPIAYIVGYRDFWSLRLHVSPATLIPRPETELLVEIALQLNLPVETNVLDLGTGSGAIALALAKENPKWHITGVDKSAQSVGLAQKNAALNQLEHVTFLASDWFSAITPHKFQLIVTNPPYVEVNSHYLQKGDVRFEPSSALTSGLDGLDDIRLIVAQSREYLTENGWLLIEHGYQQQTPIWELLTQHQFTNIRTECDLNGLPRVTLARA